ncbi:SRPBCC family protein [Nocardioides sp. Kera G14]|uniref:SRPBCC family protein n=1 Tax=Nocardioides sp. Kera G14 TaxID=2884264 RepID=UPI001D111A81|nr:SRPBCC family protein [Nocardioides sp. Kera G14]UDY24662.1 SRPBCC domain-containing protein [Nocardioides sp. Kera G14]
MPITHVTKDPEALTMTVVADFPAPLRRLWDAYVDPRQLERFWGPPEWPATFTRHDAAVGGVSSYLMRGPDGSVSRGYWEWLSVDELKGFEVLDGFALEDGTPNREMPSMRMVFAFEAVGSGSRVTTTTYFNAVEEMEQLVEMGMEDGMRAAMGQMDSVLTDLASFAAGNGVETQILSDTLVRVSRVIRGSVADVWRAHDDAELMRQWLLGPDGWTMPVCEIASTVGQTYRYEWAPEAGTEGERFGFTGELLESMPPVRVVTTEAMIGMDGPSTTNEMTLTPVDGGTLLSLLITYPSAEVRDMILATGMTTGMETSYQRLESLIA